MERRGNAVCTVVSALSVGPIVAHQLSAKTSGGPAKTVRIRPMPPVKSARGTIVAGIVAGVIGTRLPPKGPSHADRRSRQVRGGARCGEFLVTTSIRDREGSESPVTMIIPSKGPS